MEANKENISTVKGDNVVAKPKIGRTSMHAVEAEVMVAPLPKPMLRSDAEVIRVLTEIIASAPEAPLFFNLTEVTVWQDKVYNPWLRRARSEAPK